MHCSESGGGWTNTGDAVIIAGPEGQPLRPSRRYTSGHLAGGRHADFGPVPGMYRVTVRRQRADFDVTVDRLVNDEWTTVMTWSGNIDQDITGLPAHLEQAVVAAATKSLCYHCRGTHYTLPEPTCTRA